MKSKEGKRRLGLLIIVLVFIAIVISLAVFWFLYQLVNYLEFESLDVGQGDAELIKMPKGQVILVDGGPDNKVMRRLGEELPFWQTTIDLVILTHPHDDHLVGLIEVFKRYQVKNLLLTEIDYSSSVYQEFMKVVQNTKTNIIIHDNLEKLTIDDLNISPLYPLTNLAHHKIDNLNNSSIVLLMSYHDIKFLLMGDAEQPVEKELLAKNKLTAVQIIKLGHHGSDTSSSEEFLKIVNPLAALISVGKENTYGHPSAVILKRLERLGIKEYLTSVSGTIKVLTNGQWLKAGDTCLIANCPL